MAGRPRLVRDLDVAGEQVGEQGGVVPARRADGRDILGRGKHLAAEIEIDHAQRQAMRQHDGHALPDRHRR